MKFKVDENLPVEVAVLLAHAGHDAHTVDQEDLSGSPDEDLLSVARQEGRVLITLDLDFSNIYDYPPGSNYGLVVLRLRNQAKPNVLRRIRSLLPLFDRQSPERQLWIVEKDRVRVREA